MPTVQQSNGPNSLKRDASEDDHLKIAQSCVRVAIRGFAVGGALHAGAGLLTGLTSKRLQQNPLVYLRSLLSSDLVRFASFIAASGSIHKAVTRLVQLYFGSDSVKVWWGPAAGGLAAGLASLIDSPSRRRTIMFYILARAIGSLVQILASHHLIPSVPHASGLIYMCIQPLIVLLACHFPKFLPPAYYHSLLKWCQYYTDKKLRVYLRDPAENFIPCSPFMHPGSCHTWAVKDLISGFIMLAKIYSVIYGISGVVYKHKQLFTNPLKWALDTSRNIANSALFFALDAAIIKYTLCLLRNWYKRPPPVPYLYPLICGTVAGFTIFLERPSRQLELVYYCSPQLIYSVWQLIATKKLQHRIPHGSVWLLSLSLMVLSHAAEHNRNTLAPIISNGLHFLLKD